MKNATQEAVRPEDLQQDKLPHGSCRGKYQSFLQFIGFYYLSSTTCPGNETRKSEEDHTFNLSLELA